MTDIIYLSNPQDLLLDALILDISLSYSSFCLEFQMQWHLGLTLQ